MKIIEPASKAGVDLFSGGVNRTDWSRSHDSSSSTFNRFPEKPEKKAPMAAR